MGEAAIARYGEKQYIKISEERLDLVDGDAIFYFTYAAVDPKIVAEQSTFLTTFNEKPISRSALFTFTVNSVISPHKSIGFSLSPPYPAMPSTYRS